MVFLGEQGSQGRMAIGRASYGTLHFTPPHSTPRTPPCLQHIRAETQHPAPHACMHPYGADVHGFLHRAFFILPDRSEGRLRHFRVLIVAESVCGGGGVFQGV